MQSVIGYMLEKDLLLHVFRLVIERTNTLVSHILVLWLSYRRQGDLYTPEVLLGFFRIQVNFRDGFSYNSFHS